METLKVTPTLVIGLGGTGSEGIQCTKRMIRKQLEPYAVDPENLDAIPFVKYLSIDTNDTEKTIEYLTGDEFQYIGALGPSEIKNYKMNHPAALKWFPDRLSSAQLDAGARGVRHLGRLCFFKHKSAIQEGIMTKINVLKNSESLKAEVSKTFKNISVDTTNTHVHIISSMCGGTGAACLLDIAYLVRYLLAENYTISAHLVGPEAFEADNAIGENALEYIRANFYITIAEIERFNDVESNYSNDLTVRDKTKIPWNVFYLDNEYPVMSHRGPFDFAYLLGSRSGGDKRTVKQINEVIGAAISVKTVRPEQAKIRGGLANMPAHVTNKTDDFGKLKKYSSYNLSFLSADLNETSKEYLRASLRSSVLEMLLEEAKPENYEKALSELTEVFIIDGPENLKFSGILPHPGEELFNCYNEIQRVLELDRSMFINVQEKVIRQSASEKKSEPRSSFFKGWFGPDFGGGKLTKKNTSDLKEKEQSQGSLVKVFEGQFEDRKPRKLSLEEDIKNWPKVIGKRLIAKSDVLLSEGWSIKDLGQALKSVQKLTLNLIEKNEQKMREYSYHENWIGNWVKSANFVDLMIAEKMREQLISKFFSEVLPKMNDSLTQTADFIEDLSKKCDAASKNLNSILTILTSVNRPAKTEIFKSVFTLNEIDPWVNERKTKYLKDFVRALSKVLNEGTITFFAEESKEELRSRIEEKMKEIFERAYRECSDLVKTAFSRESKKVPLFESLSELKISELVKASSPLWDVNRIGLKIEELALTNVPQDSQIGTIIGKLGRFQFHDEGNNNGSVVDNLVIFRSEHGAPAASLKALERCHQSVYLKLGAEGKNHIKDLSLDPAWGIEDPMENKSLLNQYAVFSLSILFKFIDFQGNRYILKGRRTGEKDRLLVAEDSKSNTSERYDAFSYIKNENIDIEKVIKIKYESEIKDTINFKLLVEQHIESLESSLKEAEGTTNDLQRLRQYRLEIRGLRSCTLAEIQKAIRNKAESNGHGK